MPFVMNRIPSEEFSIAVCSVGILTRTGTHLKLIRSCHNCNRQVADHFHPQIGGGHFFFSAFGRTPPLLPLVRDPRPATPLGEVREDRLYHFRNRWDITSSFNSESKGCVTSVTHTHQTKAMYLLHRRIVSFARYTTQVLDHVHTKLQLSPCRRSADERTPVCFTKTINIS